MFGGQAQNANGNNFNNGPSVTTRLYTSYSDTASLVVSAWNEQISIRLSPLKGRTAEGIRQYSNDNNECIITALSMDNVTALLEGIHQVILPAINENKSANVTVITSSGQAKKTLVIATNSNEVTLTVYVGVNDNNIADPNNCIYHTFNKKEYISNYNPIDGSGKPIIVESDFIGFMRKLDEVYKLSSAIVHAFKKNEAYKNAYSGSKNNYSSGNNNYQSNADTNNANSFNDFIPFN